MQGAVSCEKDWPAACVDTDPTSCTQQLTFAGLAHHHDGIGLKAMLLRLGRRR